MVFINEDKETLLSDFQIVAETVIGDLLKDRDRLCRHVVPLANEYSEMAKSCDVSESRSALG